MRILSLMALASFMLWLGVYFYANHINHRTYNYVTPKHVSKGAKSPSLKRDQIEKLREVISSQNIHIEKETQESIESNKKDYVYSELLKNKQALFEQSFLAKKMNTKESQSLQKEVAALKQKLKLNLSNTDKWDIPFIYFLLINENMSFQEINELKTVNDLGFGNDEMEYINKEIYSKQFNQKIKEYKNIAGKENEQDRKIAGYAERKFKSKYQDEFIEDVNDDSTPIEEKMIEMNYTNDEKQEMRYGNN